MSRLVIVIQEKGGLLKTFLSVHLTQFLLDRGHEIRPVDLDATEGLIRKVFPEEKSACVSPSLLQLLRGESMLPQLMERAIEGHSYLIDCGANVGEVWEMLFTHTYPGLLDMMVSKGVKITLVIPVDADEKSRESFAKYAQVFPHATRVLCIVRKYRHLEFPIPEHPADLTINIPPPPERLFETYRARRMSMDAIARSDDPKLGMDRSFARGYLPQLHAEFSRVIEHLLP